MRLRNSLLAIGACVFTMGRVVLTITDEYKIQGGTRIYICQQVFHNHTYSSHSNRIDKTYCSCYSRPQDVTVYCVSRKATCYLYFSLLKLI